MAHATIKLGSTGADVSEWQGLLTSAGFPVAVTGTFDEATRLATVAWQKSKGLDADRIVGPKSWGAMLGLMGGNTMGGGGSGSGGFDWTPAGPVASDIASVVGLEEHTDNLFRYAVAVMSTRLKVNPDYVVAAMAIETNKTFSPAAENPLSHAIGLIQFMPNPGGSASKLTGLSSGTGAGSGFEFLRNLTPIDQLVYVEKYFKPFTGKMNNPNDAYLAVFYPSAMGKPADFVIANEGTKVYEQNAGFDTGKKGYITAGDVGKAATNILAGAEKRPRIPITPEAPPVEAPPGGIESSGLGLVPKLGLLGGLAVGAYYLWRWWSGR